MKKCLLFAAVAGLLVLTACSGRAPTRCNQWGWYKPCDLVEGQRPCEPVGCQYPDYKAGQVVSREYAYPVSNCRGAGPEVATPAAPTPTAP